MICAQAASQDYDDIVVRVDRIMNQMLQKTFFRFPPCAHWQPEVNFYETDHAYYLCFDLAGVDAKQVELQIQGGVLRIAGHRPTPTPPGMSNARLHVMEIDHGTFQRSIKIPSDVDVDQVQARQANGLLWIEMPRK